MIFPFCQINMRKVIFLLTFVLFIVTPVFTYALDCGSKGVTVIFINGIFSSEASATADKDLLKYKFLNGGGDKNVAFYNGFNPSHLSGLGDLIKVVMQAYQGGSLDYDLTTILRQVHSELSTRKVLLVGHSQGTFYTNAAYDYLISHGVPKESVAVYNVGTPADKVAGGGNYLTSSTDKVINFIARGLIDAAFARPPLPANITIPLPPDQEQSPLGGHYFSEFYLKEAPDKIIGDIQREIDTLSEGKGNSAPSPDGCFVAPDNSLDYQVKGLGFAAADTVTGQVAKTTGLLAKVSLAVATMIKQAADYSFQAVADGVNYVYSLSRNLNIAKLLGASLISSQAPQYVSNELISPDVPIPENMPAMQSSQPPTESAAPAVVPDENDKQDQIDDLMEKIDELKQRLAELSAAPLLKVPVTADVQLAPDTNTSQVQTASVKYQTGATMVGASGGRTIYPKLLISEVQIGGATDQKQEFVELFNPNPGAVDLTHWYMQRKTKTSASYATFAPSSLFEGKKISAGGFFLIARQGSGFSGDVFVDNPLTEDNTLALKNPGEEISDKVGWGQAADFEVSLAPNPSAGQSIGRASNPGSESDTDNNAADFQMNIPTPGFPNRLYVVPLLVATKDTIAPTVVFKLNAVQNTLAFAVTIDITDAGGAAVPSGIAGYTFRWKEAAGDWHEDAYQGLADSPVTFSVARDFTGDDEKTYYFQVKTKDGAGNESDWQTEIPTQTTISLFKKVLINEIQVAGITTKDEFIELYNPNSVDMNLTGFSLKKKTSGGTESNVVSSAAFSGTIKSLDYFLIAPPDNADGTKNYTEAAPPDLQYSGKTFSIASNNTVLLYDASGTLLDKVGFGTAKDFETAPAQNPDTGKSIERKKLGQDTDDNSQDFKVSDTPTPKGAFPKVILQDATDYSNDISSSSPGAPAHNLVIKWQSPSQNINFYQVQYKLNDGEWTDWLANTQNTQENFPSAYSLLSDHGYYFRARAQDADGNLGSWSPQITVDLQNHVVINEITYAGTNVNTKSQWIELYNKSDNDVALDGWNIVSGTNGTSAMNIVLKGTIAKKGYFVLGNGAAASDVPADQVFTGELGKSYVYLRNQNNRYIDQLYTPSFAWDESSFIDAEGNRRSLERVSPYSFGMFDKNWKINRGSEAYNTLGRQNSVYQMYTYYATSFIEDTVLKQELSPWVFSGLATQIFKGVTLTIEPGTVIKFYDSQSNLTVNGTLKAIGGSDLPIVFTSFRDDQDGGDANGDQDQTAPAPGDWLGVYFSPDSVNSQLDHVDVRYGGATLGFSPLGWGNTLWVDHTAISLKNSVIEENKNRGLMLQNSNSVIDSVAFLNNNITDWPPGLNESKAVDVQGASPVISNSRFENNSQGVYVGAFFDQAGGAMVPSRPSISNNSFTKNVNPIWLDSLAYPILTNNQAIGNQVNATVFNGNISQDTTLQPDLPYLIKRVITVPENTTLTLNPGVIMEFQDSFSGLQIEGTLKAVGSPDQPIVFRPHYYNQDWIAPGNWLGLSFTNTSSNSDVEYADISYAGAMIGSAFGAAIKVDQSPMMLKNSIIHDNANNGVWLVNSASTIDASTLLKNDKALYAQGGSPVISNSDFESNSYGVYMALWHPEAGDDVAANPDLEHNQFSNNSSADIFPVPAPATSDQTQSESAVEE